MKRIIILVIISIIFLPYISIFAESNNTTPETPTKKELDIAYATYRMKLAASTTPEDVVFKEMAKRFEITPEELYKIYKKVYVWEKERKGWSDIIPLKAWEQETRASTKKDIPIKYEILSEKVTDAPIKTQILLEILVSGGISETSLKNLLNNLYVSAIKRSGFKYHKHPTNVYIYAYISKEHYESEMGQWIAMLDKSQDNPLRTNINKRQISQIGSKPEQKFDLSEKQRKKIWVEMVHAEDKSWAVAEKKYPLLDPFKPGHTKATARAQMERQADLQDKLNEEYKGEIAKKYGITREQLKEIAVEGLQKGWPFPKEKY